jgi:hypothetical protein
MRESEVFQQLDSSKKKIAMIYRQMVFLDTRMQAFETIFKQKRMLMKALFNIEAVMEDVDAYQAGLLAKHDEEVRTLAGERLKPKIQIVPANGVIGGK